MGFIINRHAIADSCVVYISYLHAWESLIKLETRVDPVRLKKITKYCLMFLEFILKIDLEQFLIHVILNFEVFKP